MIISSSLKRSNYPSFLLGGGLAVALLGLFIALFLSLLRFPALSFESESFETHRLLSILLFSFSQATLSTLLSLLLAFPLAKALARRRFWGRSLFISFISLAFILPTLSVIQGISIVFGRSGWINTLLGTDFSPYGLAGILLAHTFLNAPLITRSLLQSYESLPDNSIAHLKQLNLSPWTFFKVIDRPALSKTFYSVVPLVFLLCFTSFAIVLTFGNNPNRTTFEVAIFEALRFSGDFKQASYLALTQILCVGLFLGTFSFLFKKFSLKDSHTIPLYVSYQKNRVPPSLPTGKPEAFFIDTFVLCFSAALFFLPLLSLVVLIFHPKVAATFTSSLLWRAAFESLLLAFSVASITVVLGLLFSFTRCTLTLPGRLGRQKYSLPLSKGLYGVLHLSLLTPALVFGAGLFLILGPFSYHPFTPFFVTLSANILFSLPFSYALIHPNLKEICKHYDRLCLETGFSPLRRLFICDLPLLRKPLFLSFALSFCFSLGDFSVMALFDTVAFKPLPVLIFQFLASYQFWEATAASVLLLLLSLGVFILFDKLGETKKPLLSPVFFRHLLAGFSKRPRFLGKHSQ